MSEPYVPEPAPERGSYHDPHPGRCPHCHTILDVHPDGKGKCPKHGEVLANYSLNSVLNSEFREGKERRVG